MAVIAPDAVALLVAMPPTGDNAVLELCALCGARGALAKAANEDCVVRLHLVGVAQRKRDKRLARCIEGRAVERSGVAEATVDSQDGEIEERLPRRAEKGR